MQASTGSSSRYCDHRPPKVGTIRTENGIRVQCLTCGTVGPECKTAGEAFRALLKTPYNVGKDEVSRDCATVDLRLRWRLGALEARSAVGSSPLL